MEVLSKDNFIIYWFSHVIPPTDDLLRELYEKALIKKQEENSVFAACDQDYPPVVCFEQLPKGTMAVVIFLLASTDDIRCLQLLEDIMHTSNNKNCLHEVIEGLPQPAYRGDLTPEERAATFSEILQGISKHYLNGVKKGSYGTGKYSLYTWSNQTRSNGATGIGGPFAYTPSTGSWTGIPTKSVYNKGSHTPGGKGDAYLMPDCVAGLNGFLATGMNEIDLSAKDLKSSNYSDMISAFITSYEHNVGSGLKKSLYGISMTASDSKIKHGSSKETKERLDFVCADIAESINELSDKQFSALVKQLNNTAAIPGEICLIKHGWKISAEMKSFLLDHSSNAIACWNIINPKDKINNSSQLNNKLSAVTTSITALTGYSSSKCDTLYGMAMITSHHMLQLID